MSQQSLDRRPGRGILGGRTCMDEGRGARRPYCDYMRLEHEVDKKGEQVGLKAARARLRCQNITHP